jgi:type II secretory pathway predicted ATPase ExeA
VLTTDLGAYVPRPESERVAEALQVSLLVGRRIIALTGPRGIGKTMLLHVVARRLQRAFRAVYLPFAALPAPELCALILDVLGLPSGDDPEADLLAATARLEQASRSLVVMIDDASALSLASARRLARVVSEANGSLRLILVPEDDFQSGRTLAALGDDLDEVRFGVPMTMDETARYLRLRLEWARAAQDTRQRFDGAAIERLHALSGGLPRLLNELARAVARGGVGVLEPGAAASAVAREEALRLGAPLLDEPELEAAPAQPEPEPAPGLEPEAPGEPDRAEAVVVPVAEASPVARLAPVAEAAPLAETVPEAEVVAAAVGDDEDRPGLAAAEPAAGPAPARDEMPLEVRESLPEEPPPREDEGLVAVAAALSASEEPGASGPISEADLYADDGGSGDDDLPVPVTPRPATSAPLSRHLFAASGGATTAAVIELPHAVAEMTSPRPELERTAPAAAVARPGPAQRPLPPAARPLPRASKRPAGPVGWDDEDRAEEALASLLGVEEAEEAAAFHGWRDDVEDFDPGAERLLPGSRGSRTDAPPSWKGFVSAVLVVGLLIAGAPWLRSWLQPDPSASQEEVAGEAPGGPGVSESGPAEATPAGEEAAVGPRPDPQAQAPVKVEVRAETAATVEVDGVYLGATPLKDVPLLPGEHVFRTRFADGRVVEQRIQVGPDSRRIDLVPERAVVDRARR